MRVADIDYEAYSSIPSDGTAANPRGSKEPEKQAMTLLARYGLLANDDYCGRNRKEA
jgi:hypothetical protein